MRVRSRAFCDRDSMSDTVREYHVNIMSNVALEHSTHYQSVGR
jgi:hypothetical protein